MESLLEDVFLQAIQDLYHIEKNDIKFEIPPKKEF